MSNGNKTNLTKIRREKILDSLSDEAQEKLTKFRAACNLYFKTQREAGEALGCTQPHMSRYLSGEISVPYRVAKKLEKFTKKKVRIEDVFCDRKS